MKNKNFNEVFGVKPEYFYKAPARINLIGEHIDYNGGHVLPAAISLYIYAHVSKRENKEIKIYSTNFDSLIETDLSNLEYNKNFDWAIYTIGAFYTLIKKGYHIDNGLNIWYDSKIPVGSGLSSSAAILDLTFYFLSDIFNLNLSRKEIALLGKEVENNYCNVSSGIMDEAIISLGKEKNALFLDCATFTYKYVPMSIDNYSFVVLKSNKKRKLTESKYNERVMECNTALDILKKEYNINNLAELSIEDLSKAEKLINNPTIFSRVRHVVTENNRVNEFVKNLINNNILELGKLLNESDKSLKEDYCVTGLHLDALTLAARNNGAIGARMTGAGFGGCAIALIKTSDFATFSQGVINEYEAKTGIKPDVLLVDIVNGVDKE
jgi:galactokinase